MTIEEKALGPQGGDDGDDSSESGTEITPVEEVDAEHVEEIAEQVALRLIESRWSAPLPPPAALQGYDDVLPGLAERIVGMAEGESAHRHDMDRQLVQTDTKTRTRAQFFAFAIALTALGIAAALALTGHSLAGLGTLLIGLGPIAGAFLTGRRQQEGRQLERGDEQSG